MFKANTLIHFLASLEIQTKQNEMAYWQLNLVTLLEQSLHVSKCDTT